MNKSKKIGRLVFLSAVLGLVSQAVFAAEIIGNLGESGLSGKNSDLRPVHGEAAQVIGVSGNGAVFSSDGKPLVGIMPSQLSAPIGGAIRQMPGAMGTNGGNGGGSNTIGDVGAVAPVSIGGGSVIGGGTGEVVIETPSDVMQEQVMENPGVITADEAQMAKPTGKQSTFH